MRQDGTVIDSNWFGILESVNLEIHNEIHFPGTL